MAPEHKQPHAVSLHSVQEAAERIAPFAHKTQVSIKDFAALTCKRVNMLHYYTLSAFKVYSKY